jgi:hypothetical protein
LWKLTGFNFGSTNKGLFVSCIGLITGFCWIIDEVRLKIGGGCGGGGRFGLEEI